MNQYGYTLAIVRMNEHELEWARALLKSAASELRWELI